MKYSDMWAWWWLFMSVMFFAQQYFILSGICVLFSIACKIYDISKQTVKQDE